MPGGAVAFLLEPGAAFVQTLFGIWHAGALAVPLSPLHVVPELAHVIADATPAVVVASRALAPRLAAAAPGVPVVIAEDLPAAPPPGPNVHVHPRADADGLMLYTSGTTGRPEGVRLSHAALAATVSSLEEAWRWRRDDRLLHVLPLHHTHGLIVALLGALWVGAEVRFLPFAAPDAWDAMAEATVFMGVPTIYAKLMPALDDATHDRARAGRRCGPRATARDERHRGATRDAGTSARARSPATSRWNATA